jgi:hypothetical protein
MLIDDGLRDWLTVSILWDQVFWLDYMVRENKIGSSPSKWRFLAAAAEHFCCLEKDKHFDILTGSETCLPVFPLEHAL